jgi:hypothetical protein
VKRRSANERPKRGSKVDLQQLRAKQAAKRATAPKKDNNLRSLAPNRDDAIQLAKLLLAGIPFSEAMGYIDETFPLMTDKQRQFCERRWMNSPILLEENSKLIGGQWQNLDKDARLQLAFDKHMAELAYLLYSRSYITADGVDARKIDSARAALMEYLSDGGTDPHSAFRRAIEDLLTGKLDGRSLYEVSQETIEQHVKPQES